jgi:hypothetical protein
MTVMKRYEAYLTIIIMLKLTNVKVAYIYNKLSCLYASRVDIVMPINDFIIVVTWLSLLFQSDIHVHSEWT